MSAILKSLHFSTKPNRNKLSSGLVSVKEDSLPPLSIPEKVAQREARLLEGRKDDKNICIDYIFFRRFGDGRSPQVAAYVLDNSSGQYSRDQIAELHRRIWLNGTAPLLYVEWPTCVDVLKCATEPVFWDKKTESVEYSPSATIEASSELSKAFTSETANRFSAYSLSTGTFWDNPENANWADADKAAHKVLIQAVVDADNALDGSNNPLMRRLLLLTVLAKYLEDRGVFPKDWFNQFSENANSFQDVLKSGVIRRVRKLLSALREKFNGDIFNVDSGIETSLTRDELNRFVVLLEANTIGKQMYLWKQYSFSYIPVEVLSHLYQHFAQFGTGAVFTPPFVADLMLDHALPFSQMTGEERVLDPTCGSGIFLVGAFRRIVHYWQSKNEWKRPGVPMLKSILKKSIFGVELGSEAIQVASFNLAIAMCDALQPKVIWRDLKFDKLIDQNLFAGDFFEQLDALRSKVSDGFTTIIGNPPFLSKLTKAAIETRCPEKKKIPIPDGQMAYRVAEEAMTLLKPHGSMCLIESAGFLYNVKARTFLADFLSSNTVETILDFVSIRKLFEGADPKTVAIVAKATPPNANHKIIHQTFRRTKSVQDRIGFELDHYDYHIVDQKTAIDEPWLWKANLLGGGRLHNLGSKLFSYPTLKQYIENNGWTHGEGIIVGKNPKIQKSNKWLQEKPFLPTSALTPDGLDSCAICSINEKQFAAPRTPARFSPPMFLIGENESLPSAFWDQGPLTFLDSIISINAPKEETKKLELFSKKFEKNKSRLSVFCLLKSSKALIGKSTALLKRDIEEIPWPINGKLNLAWWEHTLHR